MLSPLALKIISGVTFLLMPPFFLLLPAIIKRRISPEKATPFLSLSNCLAGGIFLGSGLLDLLADAEEVFHEYLSGIPLSYLLCGLGFFLVFLIEKVIFLQTPEVILNATRESVPIPTNEEEMTEVNDKHKLLEQSAESTNPRSEEETEVKLNPAETPEFVTPEPSQTTDEPPDHSHHHHHIDASGSAWLPFILLIVLSVHSFISGTAVGVASTSHSVIALLIAIVAHKWIEAFALGSSMAKSHMNKKAFLQSSIVYTIMEPLGVVVGASLSVFVTGTPASITRGVLTGVAAGTFLYVSLVDILLEEFTNPRHKFYKFILALAGFGLISAFLIFFRDTAPSHVVGEAS